MAQIIDFKTFRSLKACRHIAQTNAEILDDLARIQDDNRRTRESLERAGQCLEDALDNYDLAQERLSLAHDQHRRVMEVVDEIMESSPVFRDSAQDRTP